MAILHAIEVVPSVSRDRRLCQTLNDPRRCIEGIFQPMNISIIQLPLVTGVNGRVHPALASHLRAFGAESTVLTTPPAAKIRATGKPPRPPRRGSGCRTVVLET